MPGLGLGYLRYKFDPKKLQVFNQLKGENPPSWGLISDFNLIHFLIRMNESNYTIEEIKTGLLMGQSYEQSYEDL